MKKSQKLVAELFLAYQPVLEALSSPLRQKIMFALAEASASGKPMSVHELTEQTTLARPTISHHITILHTAGLIEPKKIGTQIFYRPKFETPLMMSKEFTQVLEAMIKNKGDN